VGASLSRAPCSRVRSPTGISGGESVDHEPIREGGHVHSAIGDGWNGKLGKVAEAVTGGVLLAVPQIAWRRPRRQRPSRHPAPWSPRHRRPESRSKRFPVAIGRDRRDPTTLEGTDPGTRRGISCMAPSMPGPPIPESPAGFEAPHCGECPKWAGAFRAMAPLVSAQVFLLWQVRGLAEQLHLDCTGF